MEKLQERWISFGNEYGTEEGGWKDERDALRMNIELLRLGHVAAGTKLVVLGRMKQGEGWEPTQDGTEYEAYCLTDESGEFILQPGEDDGERTEEGVDSLTPPKGWVWVFVA